MHFGGAEEDRTPDLLRARQALSQLSYGPVISKELRIRLDALRHPVFPPGQLFTEPSTSGAR